MEVRLTVDLRVYSMEALKKAAYAIGKTAITQIYVIDETHAGVVLRGVDAGHGEEDLSGVLLREAMDQELRLAISKETLQARNLIMAHALSKVPLLHPELENGFPDVPEQTGSSGDH